jgi:hypothetical protein
MLPDFLRAATRAASRTHPTFDILLGRDIDVEIQLLLLFGPVSR